MKYVANGLALIALLVIILLSPEAHAEETVPDESLLQITADLDGQDEDRTSADEPTLEEPALDEPASETLDESWDVLDGLASASKRHTKHRTRREKTEQRRHPLPPGKYFAMPMGNGFYCLLDAEEPIEFKEWNQKMHNACASGVGLLFGIGASTLLILTTSPACLTPAGAAVVVGVGLVAGYVGGVVGDHICPDPPAAAPPKPSSEPPISSVIPSPRDIWGGLPCPCPDPGCGCGAGCGCGCENGAGCGCGCSGGGGA